MIIISNFGFISKRKVAREIANIYRLHNAKYKGKIDIEANQGGYIKFDYKGKRYIYYNCFVESIGELE